jgi:hypothetical protein
VHVGVDMGFGGGAKGGGAGDVAMDGNGEGVKLLAEAMGVWAACEGEEDVEGGGRRHCGRHQIM